MSIQIDNQYETNINANHPLGNSIGATNATMQQMESLSAEVQNWEATHLNRSNNALYKILSDVYRIYQRIVKNDNAKAVKKGIDDFAADHEISFKSTTTYAYRLVHCIFGVEKQRVSAYGVALTEAWANNITPEGFPEFVKKFGGIEEIRKSGGSLKKPKMTAKQKAESATAFLANKNLGVFESTEVSASVNAEKTGELITLIAEYNGNSSAIVKAIVDSTSIVNAALVEIYKRNKEEIDNGNADEETNLEKIEQDENRQDVVDSMS
jgi:hypothetical protein